VIVSLAALAVTTSSSLAVGSPPSTLIVVTPANPTGVTLNRSSPNRPSRFTVSKPLNSRTDWLLTQMRFALLFNNAI